MKQKDVKRFEELHYTLRELVVAAHWKNGEEGKYLSPAEVREYRRLKPHYIQHICK